LTNKSLKQKTWLRLNPAVRRQQILDAAVAYFAEAGFGVQTRELSRRIGVSQPLLYRYFRSKKDLIAAVFDEVFLSQWNDGWVKGLKDRSLPLRDRLMRFYMQYAETTYRPEWIRIYMYAGLADLGLNREYLEMVRKKILRVMCAEFRHEFVGGDTKLPPINSRELELVWSLHGSMFYWAVRKTIFNATPQTAFELRTGNAIDLFLHGGQKVYPSLLNQQPPAKRSKTA